MESLRQCSQWIRGYVNDPRHQQTLMSVKFDWHQLCAAMDIVDDVDLALDAYLRNSFPADDGEKYLRIYGVLQALFVQQDALGHLVAIVRPSFSLVLSDVLKDIREIRNASIGHPTETKRKGQLSVHSMNRSTLDRDGFLLLSFDEKNGTLFENVRVSELIEMQRREAVRILTDVARQLRESDEAHKRQFRSISLRNAFANVTYAFEKISDDARRSSAPGMGGWAVEYLQSSLLEFETLLRDRGLDLETYDHIKYLYDEIRHPLSQLRTYIKGETSEIRSRETAIVFADALQGHFTELMGLAREIDEDYASADEDQLRAASDEMT